MHGAKMPARVKGKPKPAAPTGKKVAVPTDPVEPIDALPAVRIDGKVAATVTTLCEPHKTKFCDFWCGRAYNDADPVSGESPCRWAYKNGDGGTCWYCEREFASQTTDLTRDQFKYQIGADSALLEQWRARGQKRIEKMKEKNERPSLYMQKKRRADVKSVAVRSQDYSDMQLIRPADDFYPMDRYRKKLAALMIQRIRNLVTRGHVWAA